MNSRKKTILTALVILLMIIDVIVLVFIFLSPGSDVAAGDPIEDTIVSDSQIAEPVLSGGDVLSAADVELLL